LLDCIPGAWFFFVYGRPCDSVKFRVYIPNVYLKWSQVLLQTITDAACARSFVSSTKISILCGPLDDCLCMSNASQGTSYFSYSYLAHGFYSRSCSPSDIHLQPTLLEVRRQQRSCCQQCSSCSSCTGIGIVPHIQDLP
jgi:hypothetical protein